MPWTRETAEPLTEMSVPHSLALTQKDISRGARFIPGEVTMARRAGQKVNFVSACSPNCWYWEMPDSTRIYHWDPMTYESIGTANGRKATKDDYSVKFEDGAGPCPRCGNPNTNGGTIKP